ncbi:hypothetical protein N0V88_006212 [Collariella sp. IMI 366227]|nr:hypothetical protein N0V88_006212 [Collariella sp. IMI 366227]
MRSAFRKLTHANAAAKDSKDERLRQSNDNHAHIITVLERVLARLDALVKTRPRKAKSGPEPNTKSHLATFDLTNLFALLEVHTPQGAANEDAADESEEEAVSLKIIASQSQKKGKKEPEKKEKKRQTLLKSAVARVSGGPSWVDTFVFSTAEDKEEENEFDLYMMVYCFFEDFTTIWNHVAGRWSNNVSGWKEFEWSVYSQIMTKNAHIKALKDREVLPPHVLSRPSETHGPPEYTKNRNFKRQWIGRLCETKHTMLKDFLSKDKQAPFRHVGVDEDPVSFFLLQSDPIWPGLLDFCVRLAYSQMGHEFTRFSSVVDAAAHLYHAALYSDDDDSRLNGNKLDARLADGSDFMAAIAARDSFVRRYAFNDETYYNSDFLESVREKYWQAKHDVAEQAQHEQVFNCAGHQENGPTAVQSTELVLASFDRHALRLSPVEVLQEMDEMVMAQLEGVLTLDYFKLFDDSVILLEGVSAAFGPEFQTRVGSKKGYSHVYLDSVSVLQAQDLRVVSTCGQRKKARGGDKTVS